METKARIKPSPEARLLFGEMVMRADHNLHLALRDTLELAVDRVAAGNHDGDEIAELEREEWIDRAQDGGWMLR